MARYKDGGLISGVLPFTAGYVANGAVIAAGDFLMYAVGYLLPITATVSGAVTVIGRAMSALTTGLGTAVEANQIDFLQVISGISTFEVPYTLATPVVGASYDLQAAGGGLSATNTQTNPVATVLSVDTVKKTVMVTIKTPSMLVANGVTATAAELNLLAGRATEFTVVKNVLTAAIEAAESAASTILVGVTGKIVTPIEISMVARGANAAGADTINIYETGTTTNPVMTVPVAVLTAGIKANSTSTGVVLSAKFLTALATGKGLYALAAGAALTTVTSVDFAITYTVV